MELKKGILNIAFNEWMNSVSDHITFNKNCAANIYIIYQLISVYNRSMGEWDDSCLWFHYTVP